MDYRKFTETWQFNHEGPTTSVMDEAGNMLSKYYENATDGRRHEIKRSNDCGKYTNNLLKNTAANSDMSNWNVSNGQYGENPSNYSITATTETSNLGTKCFKVWQDSTNPIWLLA